MVYWAGCQEFARSVHDESAPEWARIQGSDFPCVIQSLRP